MSTEVINHIHSSFLSAQTRFGKVSAGEEGWGKRAYLSTKGTKLTTLAILTVERSFWGVDPEDGKQIISVKNIVAQTNWRHLRLPRTTELNNP